ncbi:hypothetical protein [Spirillospora sp. NPDC047279]|uniref:hypothetical protein n=1 Tax=Spirillospora sp. NPDC047279 TaxID=3155478 RepID=UPI003403B1CC
MTTADAAVLREITRRRARRAATDEQLISMLLDRARHGFLRLSPTPSTSRPWKPFNSISMNKPASTP